MSTTVKRVRTNSRAGKKMIAGIGTDLVEIYRIEEMLLRGRHLSRIFTTTELAILL